MSRALFATTVDITLEAFLTPLADHLREQGWQVDALANGASTNSRIASHFDKRFEAGWQRSPARLGNLAAIRQVRTLLAEGAYDLVHVHTPVAAFITRRAVHSLPSASRPAVVYTAHGFHFFEGGSKAANLAFRTLERAAAPWTDLLVTINAEDFSAACGLGGIDPQRVRLLPGIGVDCERYRPDAASLTRRAALRAELQVGTGDFMVAMIAEFAPLKRHAFALDALEACHRDDVVLCFIGAGPLEGDIRTAVVARGLSDRVRFAGYRRDVPGLLSASDALLLCSVREGLARSVLEAMASGLPVVGTDTRGIADAVTPETGWITSRNDAQALGRSLADAAADRPAAAAKGAAGRERACTEFGIERVLTAHDEVYADALAIRDARKAQVRR